MIRNVSSPSDSQLDVVSVLSRTDITSEEKFDVIGKVILEAAKKFQDQDSNINQQRQELSDNKREIKILKKENSDLKETTNYLEKKSDLFEKKSNYLEKKSDLFEKKSASMEGDIYTLSGTVSSLKKKIVDMKCDEEKRSIEAKKNSLIQRQIGAYVGSGILALSVVGMLGFAPTYMHALHLSEEIIKLDCKLKALEAVPEYIMFPDSYEKLSDAYYEIQWCQYRIDNPSSPDVDDLYAKNRIWYDDTPHYKNQLKIAEKNLEDILSAARITSGSYYL